MKKTLATLAIAASAAAMAAAESELIYSQTWTEDGASVTGASTINWDASNTFDYVEGQDYATMGGDGNRPWGSVTGATTSFTLSFDLRNPDAGSNSVAWSPLFSLISQNGTNGNHCLDLQFDGNGNLFLFNMGNSYGNTVVGDYNSGNKSIDTGMTYTTMQDTWTNFCIVVDRESEVSTLSLYVNNELVGTMSDWNPDASTAPTAIQFGSRYGTNRGFPGTVDINNIKLYNGVVVPTSADAIPEPATATLSLLALAGLAARRRRK